MLEIELEDLFGLTIVFGSTHDTIKLEFSHAHIRIAHVQEHLS